MKTDDLIATLSADAPPQQGGAGGVWLVPALVLPALGLFATLGVRADLAEVLTQPMVAVKTVVPLVVALVAVLWGLRLARPGAAAGPWPSVLAVMPAPVVMAVVAALMLTASDTWPMQWTGKTIWWCLAIIPLMAVLPLGAALLLMRQAAPTRPALTGAVLGLAAGGIATAAYSLHCIEDSPLFYASWYSTAILIVVAAGGLIGSRALRW